MVIHYEQALYQDLYAPLPLPLPNVQLHIALVKLSNCWAETRQTIMLDLWLPNSISSAPITGRPWVHYKSKMIKYSYCTLNVELK